MIEYIDIHTHHTEKDECTFSVINISLPSDNVPEKTSFSAGWHPWHINSFELLKIQNNLEEISLNQNVIAFGECGLDRAVNTSIEKQAQVFKFHIDIAKKHKKPMIIHCVKAYSDLLSIFTKESYNGNFVLHNFNANLIQTERFLKFNAFFSFGKHLMKPGSRLIELLKYIPFERIFIETDDSDYSISELYLRAANMLQIPLEEMKKQLKQNFISLLDRNLIE
jgi:TatD DNase family protein